MPRFNASGTEHLALPNRLALLLFVGLLLLAAALQATVAGRLYRWGGQPDFIFTLVLCAALLSDAGVGCLVGFGGGLLSAGIVGETVGTLLVTRALAGFIAGWFAGRMFRANILVIVVAVLAASFAAELVYFLAAPRIGFSRWFWAALVGSVWNATLSIPGTFLLRWCGWGKGHV